LAYQRYKCWISPVLHDNTLFHCNICNKNFSCSSHVSRHADSACHKNNIKENVPCNNSDETLKYEKQYTRTFRPQWLEMKEFKSWLREVPDNASSFFCLFCDRSFSGGLSQIYRHAESKMHQKESEKSNIEANKPNENLSTQTDELLLTFDERKKSAEIRYAALITEKNIAHQTAKEILSFFQDIGKDPNVLKSMTMGRTKCKNIISNVLCPVETERVFNNIQNTKFSIFIDETSDITNEK